MHPCFKDLKSWTKPEKINKIMYIRPPHNNVRSVSKNGCKKNIRLVLLYVQWAYHSSISSLLVYFIISSNYQKL